jgi:multidrug resistance efflux pump
LTGVRLAGVAPAIAAHHRQGLLNCVSFPGSFMVTLTSGKTAVFVRAPEPGERLDEPSTPLQPEVRATSGSHEGNRRPALDARGLRATLVQAFEEESPGRQETKRAEEAGKQAPAPAKAARSGLLRRISTSQVVKAAIGVGLVVFFGWMPLQTLLVASSVEAVVNSRIVTVRSPIDGAIVATPHDFTTWSEAKGAPLVRVVDDKADRARLDDLRRQLADLDAERPALVERRDLAQAALDDLVKQTRQFADGRVRQLNARVAALGHDLAAASARTLEADAAMERATALSKSGVLTIAELGRLRRDKTVAAEDEAAARLRLDEASVELDAASHGYFLGDSYNDRPDSAQRAEDMRLRVGDISAQLRTLDARVERLRADVADETERFNKRSDVSVALPASGRIWEVLTAPGEHVSRGQDLVRLLDCASAVVTANVSESVYNRLQIGAPVVFRPSAGGEDDAGTVVSLTGAAGAPANFAILPTALLKEGYHVTVAVPKIAESGQCDVGRTGRVIFQKGAAEASATSTEARALGLRP